MGRRSPRVACGFLPIILAVLGSACGGGDAQVVESEPETVEYMEDGFRVLASDVTGDGQPDVFKYFQQEQAEGADEVADILVRTELDLNGDGRINSRRTYDARGDLTLEEMDGNLDGDFDHVVYWEHGSIVRSERDEDFDGRVEEYRYYASGFLSSVLHDTDGDGAIDTWSYYDERGLMRVGRDTDGDGRADLWTQRQD